MPITTRTEAKATALGAGGITAHAKVHNTYSDSGLIETKLYSLTLFQPLVHDEASGHVVPTQEIVISVEGAKELHKFLSFLLGGTA